MQYNVAILEVMVYIIISLRGICLVCEISFVQKNHMSYIATGYLQNSIYRVYVKEAEWQ